MSNKIVINLGKVCVGVHIYIYIYIYILRNLKEELSWATNKQLKVIYLMSLRN